MRGTLQYFFRKINRLFQNLFLKMASFSKHHNPPEANSIALWICGLLPAQISSAMGTFPHPIAFAIDKTHCDQNTES
jgi:hypothetical protein